MGTWIIKNEGNTAFPSYSGAWSPFDPNIIKLNQIAGADGLARWSPFAQGLYLDGSPTVTEWDNLPENFQIATVNRQVIGNTNWGTSPGGPYAGSPPPTDAATLVEWFLNPINIDQNNPNFSAADGVRPKPNNYNGLLQAFITQCQYGIRIVLSAPDVGAFINFAINATGGTPTLSGTYETAAVPTNPNFFPSGGIDLGGAATIQALTDASGIYTLIPNQYHDQLYHRVGTTTTTVNVAIPEPFFKTGFIENR